MDFIDSHAHLYLEHYENDRNDVINRAIHEGVTKIVLPNIDSFTTASLKKLCSEYRSNCYPLMGLHPTSVKSNFREELKEIQTELENDKYYGIGEIGIDLYWDKTFIHEQIEAFRIQIGFALDRNMPVVIHARESFNEIFSVLNEFKGANLKGVFHAFTGNSDQAEFILKNFDFFLGIGGIITFKNSGLDKVIGKTGLDKIILETDSPYLAPVPFRGKRNESSYILYIAEKVAEIFLTTTQHVSEITTQNSLNLFKLA